MDSSLVLPQGDPASDPQGRASPPEETDQGLPACPRAPRVLVVDGDDTLFELLKEWLTQHGCQVARRGPGGNLQPQRFDLALVDVPFPRRGGLDLLRRVAGENPGTPIVALSSNFFPGIESGGAVARSLGVARVFPIPVSRDALIMAVRELLRIEG